MLRPVLMSAEPGTSAGPERCPPAPGTTGLPAAIGIAPVLVPVTATCVALLFTGAVIMRLHRAEKATIVPDLVYLALAVFVAWGRFGSAPFTS